MFPEEFYLIMHLVTPTQTPSDAVLTGLSVTSGNITLSHPV